MDLEEKMDSHDDRHTYIHTYILSVTISRVISVAVRDSEMVISMVMLAVPIGFYILLMISGVKIQQVMFKTLSLCMYVCIYVCMYVFNIDL